MQGRLRAPGMHLVGWPGGLDVVPGAVGGVGRGVVPGVGAPLPVVVGVPPLPLLSLPGPLLLLLLPSFGSGRVRLDNEDD